MRNKITALLKDKSKRNFFIYGCGQVFNLLSPLIVAPFIISVCQASGFAKVGYGFALTLFLILIVDYAFDIKGTKSAAENRDNPEALQKLLNTTIFTKIVLFGIVSVIVLLLVFTIPYFKRESTLFLLSMMIVFAQVFNPVWFLQGLEQFPAESLINIFSKSLYVVLVLSLLTDHGDYIYVNLYLGASSLLFNLIGLLYISKKRMLSVRVPKPTDIIQILKADFTFCLSQLSLSVRQLSPLLLTGYFLGDSVAGQYKVMEQVISTFRTFIQVFIRFFFPQTCYRFAKSKREGWEFWHRYSLGNLGIVITGLLVIFIFSPQVLHYYHLSADAVQYMDPIFGFSLVITVTMAFTLPLEQLMFLNDRNRVYIPITVSAAILNVILIALSVGRFGLAGIITSLFCSELFLAVFYFYYAYIYTRQLVKHDH